MLKIIAQLPDRIHWTQLPNKGDRFQWADKATEDLRILSPDPDPWGKDLEIGIAIDKGITRARIEYPKRLNLLCYPVGEDYTKAQIIRERWKGKFAHSLEETLMFFAFPVEGNSENDWLLISIIPSR